MLTKTNVDDRDENVFNRLTDNVFGIFLQTKGTFLKDYLSDCSMME